MKGAITPTPWSIDKDGYIRAADGVTWILHIPDEIGYVDAAAVVLAVNGTYGKGINPDAVYDIWEALKMLNQLVPALLSGTPIRNADEIIARGKKAIEQSKL